MMTELSCYIVTKEQLAQLREYVDWPRADAGEGFLELLARIQEQSVRLAHRLPQQRLQPDELALLRSLAHQISGLKNEG
jgi:hypothetical protein